MTDEKNPGEAGAVADVAGKELAQLRAERDFLRLRASHAGRCIFDGKRWTGQSSNGLVDIAFGETSEAMPYDGADLASCYRLIQRLPAHLLSDAVIDHLERGEAFVGKHHDTDVEWARADAEWEGAAHYRALAAHLSEQGATAGVVGTAAKAANSQGANR
jgi:hypothetical protein